MRVEETEAYRDWINSLPDFIPRARIQVRVDRLVRGTRLLLLLAGGDKSTQQGDIATARWLAQNYEE